jgi:hypothetical protein
MTGRHRPIRGEWGDPILRMQEAQSALSSLIDARHAARAAGAVKTVRRIQSAISSAKGAVRNAEGQFSQWAERHRRQEPEQS